MAASTSAELASGATEAQTVRGAGGCSPDGASAAVPKSRTTATRLRPGLAGVSAHTVANRFPRPVLPARGRAAAAVRADREPPAVHIAVLRPVEGGALLLVRPGALVEVPERPVAVAGRRGRSGGEQ